MPSVCSLQRPSSYLKELGEDSQFFSPHTRILLYKVEYRLQMAPYNTQYERLPVHLQAAGVDPSYNLWDQPVTLARHHKPAVSESLSSAASPGILLLALVQPHVCPSHCCRASCQI